MSECHRTKSLSKGINIVSKTKGPQIRYIPHRRRELAQCKSNCRSRWFNSLRKKRTLKAQVLSREAKTLAQYK